MENWYNGSNVVVKTTRKAEAVAPRNAADAPGVGALISLGATRYFA